MQKFVKTKVKWYHCWSEFRVLSSETDNLNMFNHITLLPENGFFKSQNENQRDISTLQHYESDFD